MTTRIDKRKRITVACAIAFFALQIVVCTIALAEERPARWSWQMYSGIQTQSEFIVVFDDGREETADVRDYLGYPRTEIDLAASLPQFICAANPEATSVKTKSLRTEAIMELRCER